MWTHLNEGFKWWLIFVCFPLAWLLSLTGCSTMYPKMLDDPATIKAFQEMVRDSNKTWTANGEMYNPEVEFFYKISVGGRVIGVTSELGASGASGAQVPAPPAPVDLGEPSVRANQPSVLQPDDQELLS